MRRSGRTDNNQTPVVKALRNNGMTVEIISSLGDGRPDLLVGWRGINTLLEVKDRSKKPSAQALTALEKNWHDTWGGQRAVVGSAAEAIDAVIAHARACGVEI